MSSEDKSSKAVKLSSAKRKSKNNLKALYSAEDYQRPSTVGDPVDLPPEKYRSVFRRDYARLIHSPGFRRLQGKAQLFPCQENDFFRNRLSHSLEVAQIAKSIAIRLNDINPYFRGNPIDTDLVEFAGLAHDIGHPPFGHNGEEELDRQMFGYGGFEGNAQTLRILSRLEKKETLTYPTSTEIPDPVANEHDQRLGLNLTYRSLAAVLKYDRQIPAKSRGRDRPVKGYYVEEGALVREIKSHVAPTFDGPFKTIECSIMDIADDIAYSTYDLEDAFKGGFLTPLSIMSMPDQYKSKIVEKIAKQIAAQYGHLPVKSRTFGLKEYNATLRQIFSVVLEVDLDQLEGAVDLDAFKALVISMTAATSENICKNGYYRTAFTSDLVGRFIRAVNANVNDHFPAISEVKLDIGAFIAVEILKTVSFEAVIMSSRLKSAENRGQSIIKQIFEELVRDEGYLLMPEDWRQLVESKPGDIGWRRRTICDYVAGMTDAYCVEFYDRILGRASPSIQKQH